MALILIAVNISSKLTHTYNDKEEIMRKWLMILGLSISLNAFADFNSASDLYDSGDYTAAHKEFLSMAQVGEKRSQFNLGVMYYYGQHVEKDINKAYAWMKLSIQGETSKDNERAVFKTISSKVENKEIAESEYHNLQAIYSTDVLLKKLYPILVTPTDEHAYEAVPISIVEPKYPHSALLRGLQGRVSFQFDIDKLGVPRNIQLLESFPEKIFDKNSVKTFKKWRFETATDSTGKKIQALGLRYTLEYHFEDAGGLQLKKNLYENSKLEADTGNANAQYKLGYWSKNLSNLISDTNNPNDWFLKAAVQGHSSAQYELGRSLIYGQGCHTDKEKGIEWLTRSAENGQGDAKLLLGSLATKLTDYGSQERALAYFNSVDELSNSAKLDYAWLLATSPHQKISNPEKAIDLSNSFSRKSFFDQATLSEIKAAAYAAMGKFELAIDLQKVALEEAEDMKADVEVIKMNLALYEQKPKWF
jgi:TonB family protein